MNIESFEKSVSSLEIKKVRILNDILGKRMNELVKLLHFALPQNLRKRYGYWDALSNLVWNGGCTYTLYQNIGLDINDTDKERYYKRGRTDLEPVINAWSMHDVVLKKIDFCPTNNGIIEAHFELR